MFSVIHNPAESAIENLLTATNADARVTGDGSPLALLNFPLPDQSGFAGVVGPKVKDPGSYHRDSAAPRRSNGGLATIADQVGGMKQPLRQRRAKSSPARRMPR
jgi:hypothetical protein